MKVSVILTSYNKEKYVRQAIYSVMGQTFRDFELLLIDDRSSDNSDRFCREFMLNHENVRCFATDLPAHGDGDAGINRYAHNINLVFPKSKGEYITYLCDDDLYLPWRLEAFSYILDTHKDVDVVDVDVVYGQQQLMEEKEGTTYLTGVRDTVGVTFDAAQRIDHSSVMHRRECFEKVGGWDESAPMRYGDAYFWTRLNKAGYGFHPVAIPMDCHRFTDKSVTYKIIQASKVAAT